MIDPYFPKHEAGFYLQHNVHKDYYQSAADWIKEQGDNVIWENEHAQQQCIDSNSIWSLQWYPNTPVGSYHVAASTFQGVIDFARRIEQEANGS